MKYRREIDGLRALAVLPVLFFHVGWETFSGGYVGVDVFFVISGYLITSILMLEAEQQRFSIVNFYERRARRILPMLFLIMALCIPFAWMLMLPHQLQNFAQSLVATALFASNIFFYLETDYFNDFAETAPLLHTWSLAVEEQFYLFFPLLVVFLHRYFARYTFQLMVILSIVSFVAASYWLRSNQIAVFYFLPTRAWELLLGSLLAMTHLRHPHLVEIGAETTRLHKRVFAEAFAWIGLALIMVPVVLFDKQTRFPGWNAAYPVIGTVLVIHFSRHTRYAQSILASRAFVGIGLISYSLYLWHQPILAFYRAKFGAGGHPSVVSAALMVGLSIGAAWWSWKYVEAPFRNRTKFGRGFIFSASVIGIGVFSAIGYFGHHTDGLLKYSLSTIDPEQRHLVIDREREFGRRDQRLSDLQPANWQPFTGDGRKKILILGDSVANDFFISLMALPASSTEWEVRKRRLDDPCMGDYRSFLTGEQEVVDIDCKKEISNIQRDHLLEDADVIVLSAMWQFYTVEPAYQLALYLSKEDRKKVIVVSSAIFNDMTSLSFKVAREALVEPELGQFIFENIRQDRKRDSDALGVLVMSDSALSWVEKESFYCDLASKSCSIFDDSGSVLNWDGTHLTLEGAVEFGKWLQQNVKF